MKAMLVLASLCMFCGSMHFANINVFASDIDILTEKFAKQANLSEEKARSELELVFQLLGEEIKSGKEIQVRNFGTFYIQKREPREGRNPRTGDKIQIPAKAYPRFRSSDNLKQLVNSGSQENAEASKNIQ